MAEWIDAKTSLIILELPWTLRVQNVRKHILCNQSCNYVHVYECVCLCMQAYLVLCMYMNVSACTYLCMAVFCMSVCICVSICMCVYLCEVVFVSVCMYIFVFICMCICFFLCEYISVYMHKYMEVVNKHTNSFLVHSVLHFYKQNDIYSFSNYLFWMHTSCIRRMCVIWNFSTGPTDTLQISLNIHYINQDR